jgi:hypothetical protein
VSAGPGAPHGEGCTCSICRPSPFNASADLAGWYAETDGDPARRTFYVVRSGGYGRVCTVEMPDASDRTKWVTLRLLAASPRLAAACRAALALLEDPDGDQFSAAIVEGGLRKALRALDV